MKLNRFPLYQQKKYRVKLTEVERQELKGSLNKNRLATRKQTHARIFLQCDEPGAIPVKTDKDIAVALNVSTRSIERVRQSFVEAGLESALNPKVQEPVTLKSWMVLRKPSWLQPFVCAHSKGG